MPRDPQQLRSQRLRAVNFQGDALRMGMNWTEEDLAKPQVLVDSSYESKRSVMCRRHTVQDEKELNGLRCYTVEERSQ